MKLFVWIFESLFYPYFTLFKELPSSIYNLLKFFGGDGTPIHPLKIFENVPVVIADNFQRQNNCKLYVTLVHKWYFFLREK